MEGIMADQGACGRVVQDVQPSTSNPEKPSGMSSSADRKTRAYRQPKKGRDTPTRAERRNAKSAASSQTLQNESSVGRQQTGKGSAKDDHVASTDGVTASSGAPRAPKRGIGHRRGGGGRGRGSGRRNAAPRAPLPAEREFEAAPEPKPSDDLIELMRDSPAVAPSPLAPSPPTRNQQPANSPAQKAQAVTGNGRKQRRHRGPGKQPPPKARQTGWTAAAAAPTSRRNDPELSIPKASEIRAAALMEDSEEEPEEEGEAHLVDDTVSEASKTNTFYRSIAETYQQARAQRTLFTVPISALNRHNQLLHDNMRASLPPDDESLIKGFEHCNVIADRLLKRASGLDTSWAAQLQRMQQEYEDQLHAQKVVNERMLKHMQKEVERWQEKCEHLQAGQAGKTKGEGGKSDRSSGSKSPSSGRSKVDHHSE